MVEVGEYVRTNDGIIGKLIKIERDDIDISLKWYVFNDGKNERYINKPYIVNHSPNLIDLIEEGDYEKRKKVHSIGTAVGLEIINFEDGTVTGVKNIKSIVTHEQFKSIEYRVEMEENR